MLETSSSQLASSRSNLDHSVSELLDVVWRRKWLVAGCVAISVLLGAVYVYQAEPVYSVQARVLVQPHGWPLDDGAEARREKEFLATQAEIISSPAVIERVLPTVKRSSTSAENQDPMLTVLESLTVDPVTGTNVLSVSYRCLHPTEGIETVNGLLNSYQQFLQQLNDDSRIESLNLLTRSEERLRSELEDREAAYLDLRKQGPFVGQDRDATSFQKTLLENLAASLTEARELRIDLEQRVEMLAHPTEVALSAQGVTENGIASNGSSDTERPVERPTHATRIPVVRQASYLASVDLRTTSVAVEPQRLTDLELAKSTEYVQHARELMLAEMRERELAQHCGPKHPDLRAARQQVASWKERLESLNARAPLTLQHELSVAQTREKQLFELYQQELEKAKANDDFLVRESLELDGIERLKTIHNSIVAQLNDWHLVEPSEGAGTGVRVVVLESPSIGSGPVWPKKSLLMSLCVATGLLVGLGAVVVTKS